MKTAVIYTGAMRSFDRCLATHHWHFLRHLDSPDFFVSTYRDGTEGQAELLRSKYPHARIEIEVIDQQPDCVAEMRAAGVDLPDKWVPGQFYTHEPYQITAHPQAVLRQLWQLQKGWELMDRSLQRPNYGLIVRCRPDIYFHEFRFPDTIHFRDGKIQGFGGDRLRPWKTTASTAYWGRFGGCNDRFALLGDKAAEMYFRAYDKTPERWRAGCPIHPESLIAASLKQVSVLDTLIAEFSTMRPDGTMRAPEISASDIAHLAASR
jgi:hypothetical protein